ncbi:putative bifunctional diguanylate cyclase/phosphodiesterase [Thioclava kandeliae]|uniref:Bifunctional diguanylate cyclase/phosphodiesterase n=1 Tax=Thioclava kandeliae TaxID=3070818 RepID=A0ABV1SMD5_9RHOB
MNSLKTTSTLPSQIVLLVAAILCGTLAALWLSLHFISISIDEEAHVDSIEKVQSRFGSLREQVSIIASDYHNWDDLYLNAMRNEVDKLASNYGISANRGDIFQYAMLFDGQLNNTLSWTAGNGLTPQDGFLSNSTLDIIRQNVKNLNPNNRETFDFYGILDHKLITFSASYLLPESEVLKDQARDEKLVIAVIGKVIEPARLSEIASELSLGSLEFSVVKPKTGMASLELFDIGNEPLAWLVWHPPTPGQHLFWKLFPLMMIISIVFIGLTGTAAVLLRAQANVLINQESVSFADARRDPLTNLPNRLAFREWIHSKSKHGSIGIIALDLVRFKQINDTVGHLGGDEFLKKFAAELNRLTDGNTIVSRYGGDEFFIAVSSNSNIYRSVHQKLLLLDEIASSSIHSNGFNFDVVFSKGASISENGSIEIEELIRRSDFAMYLAKSLNSMATYFYDEKMENDDNDRRRIEASLRQCLDNKEAFDIHYQPIVTPLNPNCFNKFEALARWNSPSLGPIPPDRFISVAESSGLIVALGWHLLDLICEDMKMLPDCTVSVNVSPNQLMTPGFANEFYNRISSYGLSPNRIEIEVTEKISVLIGSTLTQEMKLLSEYGFIIALDDFGTGFSSIAYLTHMPFNRLKIDRSFVMAAQSSSTRKKMIHSIIGLGKSMGLEIVAEGVETAADAAFLSKLGVNYLQGYLYGKPKPCESVQTGYIGADQISYPVSRSL